MEKIQVKETQADEFQMTESPIKTFEYLCKTVQDFSDCMEDFLYVYDLVHDKYYISPSALKRFNIEEELFSDVSETHRTFVYEKDYDMLIADLQRVIDGEVDGHNLTYRWLDREKKPVWINCRGKSIRGKDGVPLFLIGCINELGRYPVADQASGLLTNIVIKDFFNTGKSHTKIGFIMCISIDDLHHLNEWNGKKNEVTVVQEVVDCINKEMKETQMLYRLLKDQFVIIDYESESDSTECAIELYERIQSRIEQRIEQNGYQTLYTISGGIISNRDTEKLSYDTMIQVTQFILEKMREQGPSTIYCYKESEYNEFLDKRYLLSDLRKAMLNDYQRYEVYFQPIVNGNQGDIYGAESLLRFYCSDGTMMSPVKFIPLLEDSGMIIPVGRWIIYQALSFCKKCRQYIPDFKISVNISYVQILKSNIVETIENALKENKLPPQCLVVEMTESGYLEKSMIVKKVWSELKTLGVGIALDDFGTGYSNWSSIGILLPNTIKLDREFTIKAVKNPYEHQLMTHIIEATHSLNLKICVEGIENEQELHAISSMEPDSIQGYYFGKPCTESTFLNNLLGSDPAETSNFS